MLLKRHENNTGHSAKSAGGRLCLSMQTPLTQESWSMLTMLSRQSVETYQRLTCNLPENTCPQLFKHAQPLWTNLVLKSVIIFCELISTKNRKKKKQCTGWDLSGAFKRALSAPATCLYSAGWRQSSWMRLSLSGYSCLNHHLPNMTTCTMLSIETNSETQIQRN